MLYSCGLSGVAVIITSATFHIEEMYFNTKVALIKNVNITISNLGKCFKISPVIKLYPDPLILFANFFSVIIVICVIYLPNIQQIVLPSVRYSLPIALDLF